MHLSGHIPKVHSGTCEDTYKDPEKPSIGFLDPSLTLLGPGNCQGGASPSVRPLGVTFGHEIENLCENNICCAFGISW